MNPEPFIIDIVGPIGSGKSSIIEGLSESSFLSIKQGEELDLWNYSGTQVPGLFSSFLENGEKDEVLGFQTIVLASFLMRDSKLKKALDEKYANYVNLMRLVAVKKRFFHGSLFLLHKAFFSLSLRLSSF